jgi:hypothetical protein
MLIVVELPALLQPNRDLPDRPDRERIVAPTPIIGIAIDCVNDRFCKGKPLPAFLRFPVLQKGIAFRICNTSL